MKPKTDGETFGSFFLGTTEFAISVKYVQEVVNAPGNYTQVPLAPDYLLGLFNLRGTIIPVLNFGKVLKLEVESASQQKLAIIEFGHSRVGLLFDKTGEVFRSQDDERNDFSEATSQGCIGGVFKKDSGKRIIQILKVEGVMALQGLPLAGEDEVAQRSAQQKKRGPRGQCISFRLGESLCSLSISAIQEIIRPDTIHSNALVTGFNIGHIDLRGITVPVVDLSTFLKCREPGQDEKYLGTEKRVIVLRLGNEFFGLLVDSVESIVSYFQDQLIKFPVFSKHKTEMFLGCICREGQEEILHLNHEKILSDEEINSLTHGHNKLFNTNVGPQAASKSGQRKTYITFMLEHSFAVAIEHVREIIDVPAEMMHPPGLAEHYKGILNLRGELVTIVDARSLYSMGAKDFTQSKVLVFKNEKAHFGLIVDSVEAIVNILESSKLKLPASLYPKAHASMGRDVLEAVEVDCGAQEKKNLMIIDPLAISDRVAKAA